MEALRDPGARGPRAGQARRTVPAAGPARRGDASQAACTCTPRATDKQAISHHYDVGNDFYELVLGPSMVYFVRLPGVAGVDAGVRPARQAGADLPQARPQVGMRLLDVGCGWGSMAVHAACEHGVSVVGVTLSQEQAAFARESASPTRASPTASRSASRTTDCATVHATRSPIALAGSTSGSARCLEYAADLYALLKPGGRLLNHQTSRGPQEDESAYEVDEFTTPTCSRTASWRPSAPPRPLEWAGFEVRDVEAIRALRAHAAALGAPGGPRKEAPKLVSPAGPGSGGSTWRPPP
ncbi:cyclopropane-fatty-acyl-phospholipid synthase family protein [Streptomyces sp. KL116D]|uniref:SAM-dependent methyltransferase n=1 Tax=Streptomyces sp. KL116D TaxID=3045152 RepID=UPI0035572BE5